MQPRNQEIVSFYDSLLVELPDNRDNRGKKHQIAFVVVGVIIAILVGRNKASSIHRYLKNKFEWLCEITNFEAESVISRAQLPRLLLKVNWSIVNELTIRYFSVTIVQLPSNDWSALDGKELRGCLQILPNGEKEKRALSVVNAIRHSTRQLVGTSFYEADKESEIVCVRILLIKSGLASKSITLDALHCNPTTLYVIVAAGGRYLIQVKANQEELMEEFTFIHERTKPVLTLEQEVEKHHGRIEKRTTYFYNVEKEYFDKRWKPCKISTLVVTERHFEEYKTGKIMESTVFHISNQKLPPRPKLICEELARAVRYHWQVENDNQVRDVTFKEDFLKTKDRELAKVLAALWSAAIEIIKNTNTVNYKAQVEFFQDRPDQMIEFLRDIHFL